MLDKANPGALLGTSTWAEQFRDAITISAGEDSLCNSHRREFQSYLFPLTASCVCLQPVLNLNATFTACESSYGEMNRKSCSSHFLLLQLPPF